MFVVYFAAPIQYGAVGGYFDVRFLPFALLFLLAAFRFNRVPRYLYIGLALLVSIAWEEWKKPILPTSTSYSN